MDVMNADGTESTRLRASHGARGFNLLRKEAL